MSINRDLRDLKAAADELVEALRAERRVAAAEVKPAPDDPISELMGWVQAGNYVMHVAMPIDLHLFSLILQAFSTYQEQTGIKAKVQYRGNWAAIIVPSKRQQT